MSWLQPVEDLSRYDTPCGVRATLREMPSVEIERVREILIDAQRVIDAASPFKRVDVVQELLEADNIPECRPAEERGITITPVAPQVLPSGGIVQGEWVCGPAADPSRRMLFAHGGGFISGSPQSHRPLTLALAERTDMAIFSAQYRMLGRRPLRRPVRRRGLNDVRAAYDWVIGHGPEGPGEADRIAVAGDSAGGNLILSLIQWARDQKRRAADAAVAFSPVTDVALASPSTRSEFDRDVVLGHFFERIHRVPRHLRGLLVDLFHGGVPGTRYRKHPLISPLYGKLHDLPPTLIQASECELLRDDAKRYTNKARAAGSEVEYQTWPGMVHAFQVFEPILPEAQEALDQVADFLADRGICEIADLPSSSRVATGTLAEECRDERGTPRIEERVSA